MISKAKLTGVMLAVGAASVFALTPAVAIAHKHHKVACYGVNSCKGKGSCKTSENACKGKNSCKGKGVVKMSEKKCKEKGGTTTEPEMTKHS